MRYDWTEEGLFFPLVCVRAEVGNYFSPEAKGEAGNILEGRARNFNLILHIHYKMYLFNKGYQTLNEMSFFMLQNNKHYVTLSLSNFSTVHYKSIVK